MRLLITGANGFIGSRLANLALSSGDDVRTLSRREWDGAPNIPLSNRHFGSLPYFLPPSAFADIDVVIHCAASAESDDLRSDAVNVTGTLELARRAGSAGAKGFVFFSSQSARPDAPAAYGRTKYRAERELLAMEGLDVVVLRPGLVCGRGGLFGRVLALAQRLPVVPVFAGDAIVQPIWVDDCARAAIKAAHEHRALAGSIVSLGLPGGVPLGQLVREVATATARKPVVELPYVPVSVAVRIAETIGLRPALSTTNLKGMRTARAMDTRSDMARLGVPGRSLAEIVRLALSSDTEAVAAQDRAKRILLVGAGRIGLVHAITLWRSSEAVLSGIVDRAPGALRLLRSMGVHAPGYTDLDTALAEGHDAAVIATPPASHLPLVRTCVARGLRVLVEKPASAKQDDMRGYETLVQGHVPVLVGYLLPASGHVREALDRLRAGSFGEPRSFRAFTLLDFVRRGGPQRWETRAEVAGGGVLANSATHVLSLIDAAFGDGRVVAAETRRSVSAEVEDSAHVVFEHPGLGGSLFASWSFAGFDRQENRLVITTDKGELTITTNVWQFTRDGTVVETGHQLDHDRGFDLAPDYAGGGIAAELRCLAEGNAGGCGVTLRDALRIETQLRSIYASASDVTRFSEADAVKEPSTRVAIRSSPAIVLDLRGRSAEEVKVALADPSPSAGALEVDLRHLPLLRGRTQEDSVRVTVPDFLRHVRRIGERRYIEILREMGTRGTPSAALVAFRGALGDRGLGFWTAASALVSGEAQSIPRGFRGVVLLHPYLVDLAVALDQLDRLEQLLSLIGSRHRVGLHTNLGRETANALTLVHRTPALLSVLTSARTSPLPEIRGWLSRHERLRTVHLTAEVGPAPLGLHVLAAAEPRQWLSGADSLLVGAVANPAIRSAAEAAFSGEWARQFPGLAPASGAL